MTPQAPRLDQVNSALLIRQARQIYVVYLGRAGLVSGQPSGVILQGDGGRVVFGVPTLLPNEVFVPTEWFVGRTAQATTRPPRPRAASPWSTQQP